MPAANHWQSHGKCRFFTDCEPMASVSLLIARAIELRIDLDTNINNLRYFFFVLINLIVPRYTRALKDEDVPKTSESDKVAANYDKLAEHWAQERTKPRYSPSPLLPPLLFQRHPHSKASSLIPRCVALLNGSHLYVPRSVCIWHKNHPFLYWQTSLAPASNPHSTVPSLHEFSKTLATMLLRGNLWMV